MTDYNQQFGDKGENIAIDFLLELGYAILEKNWRHNNLEIDIVAKLNDTIVIVEVKTRKTDIFGDPEEFVNRTKQKLIIKAANSYIFRKNINLDVRFDIIAIIKDEKGMSIKHIPDAFYPEVN
ncbi:MAG: hypothetical protein A2X12_11820 [Bacteroidetes bacterium GWE2_29_8]|nr:MAG: hypothetical protein A2X12_11820 [Bacteroidetes bacterium GWE2_29_8]OFY20762.1 MAG: hypothetical protein A2X02_09725 [Bacteroidetes bacterium GWF2_29_10]